VMAEALWAELHAKGVDVLGLVLSVTDTPALRRLLAKRGVIATADDNAPIAGATTAEETVAEALSNLTNGPTWFVGRSFRASEGQLRSMSRNDVVRAMLDAAGGIMGDDKSTEVAS
jgi:hypothetical protein